MDNNIFNSLAENYHVSVSQTERLYEGDGCNYRITGETGNLYILKIYTAMEEELISFITTILNFLATSDIHIHFHRPVKNISGMDYTRQHDSILALFHWIEGRTMSFVNTRIAEELGEVVGMLDNTLYEFYHAHAKDYSKFEESLWSVTNIHQFDEDVEAMKHLLGEHYRLIKETIAHFDTVYPVLNNTLPTSLIHNDINPGNLLYDQELQLTGIIDFTEICHTWRICEVGIALAYLMQISGSNYLKIGHNFIRGYAKTYHVTMQEQQHILLFTKLRLSMSILYNTRYLHGGNALTDNQARFICHAKKLLTILSETTSGEFIEKMFPSG